VVDSTLWNVLTGAGVAGVFCALFLIGLIYPKGYVDDLREELRELKAALAAERTRADAAIAAAQATRDLMTAIRYGSELAASREHAPDGKVPP
jgi:hypothetical protein